MYSGRAYLDLRGLFASRGTLVFTFAFIYHADEERRLAYRERDGILLWLVTALPDSATLSTAGSSPDYFTAVIRETSDDAGPVNRI